MKTRCGKSLKDLGRWVDGELMSDEGRGLEAHIKTCAHCQKEVSAYRFLNRMLKSSREDVCVSPGFETAFWEKVTDRQASPWFARLFKELETLIPVPALNLRQAAVFALLAFFNGNVGGVTFSLGQGALMPPLPASIQYFSGVQEFKGIASYSLAGAYLGASENKASQ